MSLSKRPKIGLALGSGGARGFAHVGVIKVLEENHIPIDLIAGSSIGAVVGGFYAAKMNIADVEKHVSATDWKKFFSLLDPCLKLGLLHGEKAKEYIEGYIGKIKFSDLKIPFAAVATDFETGREVVVRSGEVAPAIRASMSVPLAFKPVQIDGRTLVDGGMSLPVPVRTARTMGADIVIAVNLDNDYFTKPEAKLSYADIAFKSLDMLRYNLAEFMVKEADLAVAPKVGHILWYNFVTGKDALQAGEKAMVDKLEDLKQLITEF